MQFEEPRDAGRLPTWMIVVLPREQVVKSPQKPLTKPSSILKAPTHAVQEDSIAARIKACRATQSTTPKVAKADDESIAERLLRRKRQNKQMEAAFPVLDPEMGQYLCTDNCYVIPSSRRPGTYRQQMNSEGWPRV